MADYVQLGVGSVKDLFTWLSERSKSKDITKNELLREFRDNLKLLGHRDKQEVNVPALIEKLSAKAIESAYLKNYNFNRQLNDGKMLKADMIFNKRQEKYVGWKVEKFIYSIEGKIRDLKNLPVLYKDLQTAPVNLNARLDNLYYQLLLLVIFISKS